MTTTGELGGLARLGGGAPGPRELPMIRTDLLRTIGSSPSSKIPSKSRIVSPSTAAATASRTVAYVAHEFLPVPTVRVRPPASRTHGACGGGSERSRRLYFL